MTITTERYEFEGEQFVKITAESGGTMDVTAAEWADILEFARYDAAAPESQGAAATCDDPTHDHSTSACLGPRHPESYCHRCRGPNMVWSAPSPLWNAVMREGRDDEIGIVCPICFAQLGQQRVGARLWRLFADRVDIELPTTSPDGRIWDADTCLWRDRADRS